MNEYAIEFANSIKCVVEGEWVDASSGITLPSTEHGPAEHAIAGLARPAGGMSKVGGCAVQRVSVAAYCTEYFVSSLTCLAAARGRRPAPGRFGLTKWFIAPMSRSSSVQLSQRWREKLSCLRMRISLLATQPKLDYVMKQAPLGRKVVDVRAGGSISRVAVQRSDFRRILSNAGFALLASLQRKASDLSGGALVHRMSGNFFR